MREARVGDWVRFYRGGKLRVGVVEYVSDPPSWLSCGREYHTDRGTTNQRDVFEVRGPERIADLLMGPDCEGA